MDEATVGLDPQSRSDLLRLMLSMRAERAVAVLWATHLCDEVPDADRVIVLHRGKVLADTTPAKFVAASRERNHRGGIPGDDGPRRLELTRGEVLDSAPMARCRAFALPLATFTAWPAMSAPAWG